MDQILSKLLETTTDWKQLHATLEAGDSADDYAHVFLFAGVLVGPNTIAFVVGATTIVVARHYRKS